MGKCPKCGKSIKGVKRHLQRMHGGGGAAPDHIAFDGEEPWNGQGELGRILAIADAGEPLRAKNIRDLYLKDAIADNPVHDAVYFEGPSGRLKLIAKLPAGSDRRQI